MTGTTDVGAEAQRQRVQRTEWLLVVVFVAGAALMAYEIVGSRLLAPYFGSSTLVWGSLISVFLGALAAGYAFGGRLADRAPHAGALAVILATSALLVAVSAVVSEPLQEALIRAELGTRLTPLVASILLFGPASVLLGMVSPYAVRLRANDLASVGRTAGSLYGLSTFGSIVGTLLASFWAVQELGSDTTVMGVAVVLAACSLTSALAGGASKLTSVGSLAMLALLVVLPFTTSISAEIGDEVRSGDSYSPVFRDGGYEPPIEPAATGTLRASTESSYHRIRVVDYPPGAVGDGLTRVLHFDNSMQAAAGIVAGRPVTTGPPTFDYLRAFELLPAMDPEARRVALVGLGSGALAMRLHELRPDLHIDVVEIDGAVVEIARRWFGYRDSTNGTEQITTHVSDGRTWLAAQRGARFDAIVLDTYFADSIPFHLTTREFLELVRSRLTDDGIVAGNLIGAVEGRRNQLFRSMHRTWTSVFDDVAVYPVPQDGEPQLESFANVELLATGRRGVLPPRGGEEALIDAAGLHAAVLDEQMRSLLELRYVDEISHDGVPVLTDDLAPVDSLMRVEGL